MMVIDFGFNDGKVTIGTASVNTIVDGGWEFSDRAVTVKPSSLCPSGWVVGVDGVYGWDALEFIKNMNSRITAGPHFVFIPKSTRQALLEMRDSFVVAA